MGLAKEQVPQAELLCLSLEFLDDRNDRLPPQVWVSRYLCMSDLRSRKNFCLDIDIEGRHS